MTWQGIGIIEPNNVSWKQTGFVNPSANLFKIEIENISIEKITFSSLLVRRKFDSGEATRPVRIYLDKDLTIAQSYIFFIDYASLGFTEDPMAKINCRLEIKKIFWKKNNIFDNYLVNVFQNIVNPATPNNSGSLVDNTSESLVNSGNSPGFNREKNPAQSDNI